MEVSVCTVEKLSEAIRLVEHLRGSIYTVFDELVGGKTINDGIKDHRSINDKEKGKKLVSNLHMNLLNGVNKGLSMLEFSMSSLGRYPLSILPPTPGIHLLSLEPTSLQDQDGNALLYETLHNDYLCSSKIVDNSDIMFKRLSRAMKIKNNNDIDMGNSNLLQSIQSPRSSLESIVMSMNMKFARESSQSLKLILMNSPNGNMIKAIVNPVLKACIVMQGLVVDRIVVHSFNEETTSDSIWPPSKFIVFHKITEIANSAALYINNALKFFWWLSHYQNLYSQPCRGCGKILSDENDKDRFLPPIRRDFNHHELCYHLSCYQNNEDL